MVKINNAAVHVLAGWNVDRDLLAVDSKGGAHFTVIPKTDVTIWQLFLQKLGCGKLAGKEFSMQGVASHLSKDFTWSKWSHAPIGSSEHKAYLNVCQFANKALMYNKGGELNSNVAKHSITRSYYICHPMENGQGIDLKLELGLTIYWNPELKVKHVQALVSNQSYSIDNVLINMGKKTFSPEDRLGFGSLGVMQILATTGRRTDTSTRRVFYTSLVKHIMGNSQITLKKVSPKEIIFLFRA